MTGSSANVAKSVPDIIKAASASPLGIFALIILIVGALGYVYFRSAPMRVRIGIFAAFFLGAVLYWVAITKAAASDAQTKSGGQSSASNQTLSIDGMVADSANGKSIELATVTTVLSPSPVITDSNGIFHVKVDLPTAGDSVVLHVSKDGYQALDWTITPPVSGGIRILLTKGSPSAATTAAVVTSETYKSDNAASGACKDFGAWATVCSADKPDGWTIATQNFSLTGDRAGCAYADCELAGPPTSKKVCYRFRTQGHDEECGHSGNTGIHYSQGVLNVVWQH